MHDPCHCRRRSQGRISTSGILYATTTVLTTSLGNVNVSENFTLCATVAAPGRPGYFPEGTVSFYRAIPGPDVLLGTVDVNLVGVATLVLNLAIVGVHSIIAVFTGYGSYENSTSNSVTVTVDPILIVREFQIDAVNLAIIRSRDHAAFTGRFTRTLPDPGTTGYTEYECVDSNVGGYGPVTMQLRTSFQVGHPELTRYYINYIDYFANTSFVKLTPPPPPGLAVGNETCADPTYPAGFYWLNQPAWMGTNNISLTELP